MTSETTAYTVYTKPDCPQCDKTKAYFDSKGITYTAVDITEVPAALEYIVEELGYAQAPVVI